MPYDATSAYIRENAWSLAESKLLDILVSGLPGSDQSEKFVLSAPDLDSQNVLVDGEGNVSGIIDREDFNWGMGVALCWKEDWIYTKKSHIREAVWIAALNGQNRLEICQKMVEIVAGGQEDMMDALGII